QTTEQVESAATDAGIIQEPQTEGVVNETQQPSVESTEIPMEGNQVAPVGETSQSTQELVTETPIQDETITEQPVDADQETGLQDQDVAIETEQITPIQTDDAQNQETIQENEQAPVRTEEVQESTAGTEPV